MEKSILAQFGKLVAPLLKPVIGVESWQTAVCWLQGIIAKEQVVASMSVIARSGGTEAIFSSAAFGFFEPSSAYAFILFNLFSPPCVSALAALKREIGLKKTALAASYQLIAAFTFSALIRLLLVALF